jgi:hypothetical protein
MSKYGVESSVDARGLEKWKLAETEMEVRNV